MSLKMRNSKLILLILKSILPWPSPTVLSLHMTALIMLIICTDSSPLLATSGTTAPFIETGLRSCELYDVIMIKIEDWLLF